MDENKASLVKEFGLYIFLIFLVIFCAGEPDLLDAIIKYYLECKQ